MWICLANAVFNNISVILSDGDGNRRKPHTWRGIRSHTLMFIFPWETCCKQESYWTKVPSGKIEVAIMTWLIVTEYLSHKWPLICYHRLCNKNNTTGNICGAGTAYPSGAHEFTPVCSGVRVARYLVFRTQKLITGYQNIILSE